MHLAWWHHCDARGLSSPSQIGAKLGQRASLAGARKPLGQSRSPVHSRCRSCFARDRYQQQGSALIHQAQAPSQRERRQGKQFGCRTPGRGQVGLFCLQCTHFQHAYTSSHAVHIQLCIPCCEPHSYHERPHTYANNPPTPGLRLALASESDAKAIQGQKPDHPKALDAL